MFQPDPFNPCDAGAYVSVSDLMTTNQDTVLYTAPLYINTDYILLVGSNTPGCALDIRLEGRSVSIDACCAAAIDYGETVNVEVKGSDPTLGFVWTPEELAQMVDNQLATLSPYETTTFEVTGFVEGCSYTDAVLVAVGSPIEVPNALFRSLTAFVGRRLAVHNVTSRPRPGQPGAYRYVIDVEGDAGAEPLASALTDLAALNDAVQVLGSYPGATP